MSHTHALLLRAPEFARYVRERERIRLRREQGHPPPWTDDEVLRTYRFCNVSREHDRVTHWLRTRWYAGRERHQNLWLAAAMARQIGWPETLEAVGFPEDWTPDYVARAKRLMIERRDAGLKTYTGAYMLRALFAEGTDKAVYTWDHVLAPLARDRAGWTSALGTFQSATEYLVQQPGFGYFLAYQVALDLAVYPPLDLAPDRNKWALAGLGAVRGLNRLCMRRLTQRLDTDQSLDEMRRLTEWMNVVAGYPALTIHDIEHSLCEFDKYERARTGDGRPKVRYVPGRGY